MLMESSSQSGFTFYRHNLMWPEGKARRHCTFCGRGGVETTTEMLINTPAKKFKPDTFYRYILKGEASCQELGGEWGSQGYPLSGTQYQVPFIHLYQVHDTFMCIG